MAHSLQEDVLQKLRAVKNPANDRDIVSARIVQGLQVSDAGDVLFALEVDPALGGKLEPLRLEAESAVKDIPGVNKVTAVLTARRAQKQDTQSRNTPDPHGMNKNPKLDPPIEQIIVVASGKGGVGKSTVAANLAAALAGSGKSVGLMDADIYGPSQPRMMGLDDQKPAFNERQQIIPLQAGGVKVMSIGFMMDQDAPLIWRGPMVQTAVYQMLRDVAWGTEEDKLDILVVDMPPGTGDAQLTMAQKVPMAGAVIVSTPQDIALLDARKAVAMFQRVDVPILGVIENMSTHICSHCGHEEHIFGHGGARKEAEALGVPFLGEIPLSMDIRLKSDAGESCSHYFTGIAHQLAETLN